MLATASFTKQPCFKSLRYGPRIIATCRATLRKDVQLLEAITAQIQRTTLPWVEDLILPVLGIEDEVAVAAAHPRSTLPPSALADDDGMFIDISGVNLHYKDTPATKPGAPTLLLLHGFNASTFSWRANAAAIATATGCRIVSFDRPPFGLSERPLRWREPGQALQFNPYELDGSVRLATGLLDALVIGPVVVVGHSAGALVALELQKQRPSQVKALALVAPALPSTPEHSLQRRITFGGQLRFLFTRAVLQSDIAGLRYVRRQLLKQRDRVAAGELGFTPHPSTASSMDEPPSILQATEESFGGNEEVDPKMLPSSEWWEAAAAAALQEATEGYLRPLKAQDWDRAALLNLRAFTLPLHYDYERVAVPVLVVQGLHDGALTGNARALAEILRARPSGGSKITEFVEVDCGHVPMEEAPAEFNAAVIGFLERHVLAAEKD